MENISALADNYWQTYQARLAADKVAATLKAEEVNLSLTLIHQMQELKLSSIGGQLVRLSLNTVPDMMPVIKDYAVFSEYVLRTQDLSLLERRVSKSAVRERWS